MTDYAAGSTFKSAFMFLSRARRRALGAYYGYARAVDDIADAPELDAGEKAAGLGRWRAAVERIFSGARPENALESDLALAVRGFRLKKEHFLPVLEGVTRDLAKTSYGTFAELEYYMYKVAAVPGMACLAISGYNAPGAALLAKKLGGAMQLTNILRDVAEDHAAGRIYLPAQDLARFGCSARDLGGSNYTANFIELMRFEADRAEELYAGALALAEPGLKRRLAGTLVMRSLYRELLAKLRRRGFKVKGGKIRLNPAEKLKAILTAWGDYRRL
ncbi:MAG: hypothetical protein A2234_08625 [Elusimicrobia bacterium RIFOXYA2_FULL_58_8]|nr:MAG: hypothetical protein A2234_08625 [Elusimicrobia bacterium RIFOXYA2_FULL_58_8]